MSGDFESDTSFDSGTWESDALSAGHFEEEALQIISEEVVAAEEIEWLELQVLAGERVAAVAIQRAFRGSRIRRAGKQILALRRIRCAYLGFCDRLSVAKMLAKQQEHRSRRALQDDSDLHPESGRVSPVDGARTQPARTVCDTATTVVRLQQWARRKLPAIRARIRMRRLETVVSACQSVQRTWRGFVARRRFAADLRRMRWDRQLHTLRAELDAVCTAPEALRLRAALGVGVDGRGAQPTDDPLDGGAIVPDADAGYFRSLGAAPKTWRDRRTPSIEDRAVFVTASLQVVSRSLDIAEAAAERRDRFAAGRRVREALQHSRATSTSPGVRKSGRMHRQWS